MSGIEIAHVAMSTIGTIVMVGLGFLYRPDRASFLWSLAFIMSMLSAYGEVAAAASSIEPLRWASLGLGLGAPVLIWAGLRADRGASAGVGWLALVVSAGSAILLVATGPTDVYGWAFRIAYAVAAAFAGLTLVELFRRPERGGGTSSPLALFSIVFVGVAAVSLITGFFSPSLDMLRDVNELGLLVYIVCALITLLFIVRGGAISRALAGVTAAPEVFLETVSDRLSRAEVRRALLDHARGASRRRCRPPHRHRRSRVRRRVRAAAGRHPGDLPHRSRHRSPRRIIVRRAPGTTEFGGPRERPHAAASRRDTAE